MSDAVTQSQFYMWRTLFSVAHADNIVTDEEIEFMAYILEDIDFTPEQTAILKDDIINPKDAEKMFKSITDQVDRMQFFNFARDLVWVDGDFASDEQGVMITLLKRHFKETNIDELVGKISLELEEDHGSRHYLIEHENKPQGKKNIRDIVTAFRRRFMRLNDQD